ncbi:MAG: outer membrane beta-barrel protein [Bacteroidota bacterium]
MKKILIAIIALLCVSKISNAQTEKGNQTLGVNLSYSYIKSSNYSTNSGSGPATQTNNNKSFNIGPDYSYFIADNLDLGVSLQYGTNSQDNGYNNQYANQHGHGYGADLFLRKYCLYDHKVGIRAGGHVGYTYGYTQYANSGNNSFYDYSSKSNSYIAGAGLELVYYPAKKLGVAASMGNISYTHAKVDSGNQGSTKLDNFNFSFINNGLTMSAFYTFGGK